jgi:DNA-binding MarR family transcriptional regulator
MNELGANRLAALATALADRLESGFDPLSKSASGTLLTLAHWEPLSGTELARILRVSQPTVARVIQGLVRQGLVERGERVGRDVVLRLTDRGRERARALQAARLSAMEALLLTLDEGERAVLDGLVARLLSAATESRSDARHMCRFCAHDRCVGKDCPPGLRATEIERTEGKGKSRC